MKYTTIIKPEILFSHLNDPEWVIVDCRFDLMDPDWGFTEYQELHIPGAVYAHLDKDLAGSKTALTGRHPLPDTEIFIKKLSSWGINKAKQVIVYDTVGGAFAARLWWMLRTFGHAKVAVLDGGLPKWINQKYPVIGGVENNEPEIFSGNLDTAQFVSTEDVFQKINSENFLLIDARNQERFAGINEPIDPVAGHIPGAVNRFHTLNLNQDLTMKSGQDLKQEFRALMSTFPADKTIVYCGSGVTSCHHLLAMEYAGIKGARLYLGSWSEWIRDPARPIIKFKGPE